MNIDEQALHEQLTALTDEVETAAYPRAAVERRARSIGRRRAAGWAVAGAAVVAAAAVTIPAALAGHPSSADRFGIQPPPSATPTAVTTPSSCAAGQLAVSVLPAGAGLGHGGYTLQFTDTGSTCTLQGYPTVALVSNGTEVAQVTATTRGYLGGIAVGSDTAPTLELHHGEAASALLEGLNGAMQGQSCPTYDTLAITPPTGGQPTRVPVSFSLCSLEVHPVTGTSESATTPTTP